MSDFEQYDPALFVVERATVVNAKLGELVLGVSKLGISSSAWITVPTATLAYSAGYTPNDDGTLILDSESASVSLSFWDTLGDILYPADRVRATYDGKLVFLGTVDTTGIQYIADPNAKAYGATRRIDFTATLVGTFAAALTRTVAWSSLPAESAITRIRRWVTVNGW